MDIHLNPWIVLVASPRPHGNSEYAAGLAAACLRGAGLPAETLLLREHVVAPCTACGLCSILPEACSLDPDRTGLRDDAADILPRLRSAAGLIVAAPIYFYGLPAAFKALVDRSQRYWPQAETQTDLGELLDANRLASASKPAYAVLPAGRVRGERLFDGSLLTLRPWLRLLGFTLKEHLPLRGLDSADALVNRPDLRAQVRDWALRISAADSK